MFLLFLFRNFVFILGLGVTLFYLGVMLLYMLLYFVLFEFSFFVLLIWCIACILYIVLYINLGKNSCKLFKRVGIILCQLQLDFDFVLFRSCHLVYARSVTCCVCQLIFLNTFWNPSILAAGVSSPNKNYFNLTKISGD